MADKALQLLITTKSDTQGVDQVNKKLQELKSQSAATTQSIAKEAGDAGKAFSNLGSIIGASIGTIAVGAIFKAISAVKQFNDEENRVVEQIERQRQKVLELQEGILAMQDAMISSARLGSEPLGQSVTRLQQEIIKLKTEQGLLNLSTEEGAKAWKTYNDQIKVTTSQLDGLNKLQRERQALLDQEKVTAARAFGTAEDIERERRAQLYNQILERRKALGLDISEQTIRNRVDETLRAAEMDKVRAATEREANARATITPLLREQATILQNIREQEQLIRETPLMGIDEKNAALLALYNRELGVIATQIQAVKAAQQNSTLDPAQLQQLQQKLQQLQFEFQLLGLKMVGLQKPFQTSMIEWANSFGTVGEQTAKSLQQSIGVSLQSLNQMLITGKFSAQQLVEQLANIGLQLIENMAIQQIMKAFATTSAATSQAEGAATAAAWAPAAAATSVGSFGTSAVLATVALGVIAAIIAALTLHEGGAVPRRRRMHSGGLADDEVPIIAQEGEFMIQRSVAQQPGMMEYLSALNAGVYHEGGYVTIPPGFLRETYYGPGSPHPTRSDRREFTGINDIRLRAGDVALPRWVAEQYGLSPGDSFYYKGQLYRYADNPNERVGDVIDFYYPRGGSRGTRLGRDRNPFTGRSTGGRPSHQFGADPRDFMGFDAEGNPISMEFDPERRGYLRLPPESYDRPGSIWLGGPVGNLREAGTWPGTMISPTEALMNRMIIGGNLGDWIPSTIHPGYLVKQTATGDQYIPDPSYQARRSGRFGQSGTEGGSGGAGRGPNPYGGSWGGAGVGGFGGSFFGNTVTNWATAIGLQGTMFGGIGAGDWRGAFQHSVRPTGMRGLAFSRLSGIASGGSEGGGGPRFNVRRFHAGGSIGAGLPSGRSGGGGVTVLNFTDPKALTKAYGSIQGRKIIIDTVRGHRIDLGL